MFKKIVLAGLMGLATCVTSFAQETAVPTLLTHENPNILRLHPITAMDIGVGFSISYERLLGAEQKIGLVLPVSMLVQSTGNNGFFTQAYDYNEKRYNMYAYFTPGVKFYPFGHRKVTYAVGPNLLLAYGGGNEWQYRMDNKGVEYLEDVKTTRVRLGVLVNNYVNFQISSKFNLGLEGGLGFRYYDRQTLTGSPFYAGNGSTVQGVDMTGQFSLSLGYCF